jgi:threonine synthase
MKYISSRDRRVSLLASQAILQGISKEGGLFVPDEIPIIKNLERLKGKNYKELTFEIMNRFLDDFDPDVIKICIDKAYDNKFTEEEIAPLIKVGEAYFLELFHGPTFAFKDMALSILPYLLKEAIKINNVHREVVILTATSGDTGKAALEGFANIEGIKIIVFYPEEGVSDIQKRQMITQEGDNTFVVGIKGNFDDAQNGVKEIFSDRNFADVLDRHNFVLSSANSINIGRLLPQMVYYFHSYLTLLKRGDICQGEKINVVVPTGNFGNILAAYYAKKMGLPINRLICASNENNVLRDFLNTGNYDKRRELILTSSPSMDILISSNLERLLFHLSDGDDQLINSTMKKLDIDGFYQMESLDLGEFYGGSSLEAETSSSILSVFKNQGYLMDPHSAVAFGVYHKYKLESGDNLKTVIVSTASPFKFASKVASSIGIDIDLMDEFSVIEELENRTGGKAPEAIKSLKNKTIVHNNKCDKKDMAAIVKSFLNVGESDD